MKFACWPGFCCAGRYRYQNEMMRFAVIMLLIIAAGSCRKNNSVNDSQLVLFQYEYVNYAWGYQHSGFIIDQEGRVLTYSQPEGWHFPGKEMELSSDEIEDNISKCTDTGILIDPAELRRYSSYITNLAKSDVSALKNTGADMGTVEYVCYTLNEANGRYTRHLIRMEGDFTRENLNIYAKKVTAWMKDLNTRIAAPLN